MARSVKNDRGEC